MFMSVGPGGVNCVKTYCKNGRWRRKSTDSYVACKYVLTGPGFNSLPGEFNTLCLKLAHRAGASTILLVHVRVVPQVLFLVNRDIGSLELIG